MTTSMTMTTPRLDYHLLAPEAARALGGVTRAAVGAGLDPVVLHLASLRASQINGCAYCVDLHYRDALKAGVPPRTLNAVSAWRDAPFFDPRQRAALAWSEALTLLRPEGVSDQVWDMLRAHFDETEAAHLTFIVAAINAWNRISISMRKGPDANG